MGQLDPVETISGIQARLENLGFDPGPIDGNQGLLTRRATKAFQRAAIDLKVDGIAGPKTQERLEKEHGS